MKVRRSCVAFALAASMLCGVALAQCPATTPVEGAPPPGPLPLFPADNWWNADVSGAPIDAGSVAFIAFVNNGGTRRLHPDFGGEASPGSIDIYGMPYAIVRGSQPKLAVSFDYWDESDGVDYQTGQGLPFYPIPAEAIGQPHWIEGGAPGSVDQRSQSDRHLFVIDCDNKGLYELYNVFYDTQQGRWYAGSGAFFDMTANHRRPDGWTSADAAGLAVFPGLVRYDEAWNPAVTEIGHAFRVTVRATNGYVYPASHRAGSTAGALPMGARLRLKTSVNGTDPALRSSDPNVRKIFRAMQKHGLIVADNGSDMFVTGTFDTRWDNDILNPAFALLSASDFDVIQLGWKPPPACAGFADVDGASPFCANVQWIRNRAITLGCAASAYCPDAPVSRDAMAAFLNRLGTAIEGAPSWVEAATGAFDVDASPRICTTADRPAAGFPRSAQLDAVVTATATATIGLTAQLVASTDAGTSWNALGAPLPVGVAAGHWANLRLVAQRDVDAGQATRFAIAIARQAGSADVSDSRCALRVRMVNRNGDSPPYDRTKEERR